MCVVLVEDEPMIRDALSEALQDAGYDVMEAENGRQAVDLARSAPRHFTALVTDFHMPGGLTGYQVAGAFRGAFPGIRVIIVSGRPDILEARWQVDHGFAMLRKPFLPSELIRSLRAVLDPEATRAAGA